MPKMTTDCRVFPLRKGTMPKITLHHKDLPWCACAEKERGAVYNPEICIFEFDTTTLSMEAAAAGAFCVNVDLHTRQVNKGKR